MTVKEIVEKYLKDNGFGGLRYQDNCYCSLRDFMFCKEPNINCVPGWKVHSEQGLWQIVTEKPEVK